MTETSEARLKRLKMRSMRRGIKEMDIILSHYADDRLAQMTDVELSHYDALLSENDQDLYSWVIGQSKPPERFAGLLADIVSNIDTRQF